MTILNTIIMERKSLTECTERKSQTILIYINYIVLSNSEGWAKLKNPDISTVVNNKDLTPSFQEWMLVR